MATLLGGDRWEPEDDTYEDSGMLLGGSRWHSNDPLERHTTFFHVDSDEEEQIDG